MPHDVVVEANAAYIVLNLLPEVVQFLIDTLLKFSPKLVHAETSTPPAASSNGLLSSVKPCKPVSAGKINDVSLQLPQFKLFKPVAVVGIVMEVNGLVLQFKVSVFVNAGTVNDVSPQLLPYTVRLEAVVVVGSVTDVKLDAKVKSNVLKAG